jgi:hypothetical protein
VGVPAQHPAEVKWRLLMSAYLDKSQGITFVYSNIYQLYKKAKNAKLESPFVIEKAKTEKVLKKMEQQKVEAFVPKELTNPSGQRAFPVPMGVKEAEDKALKQNLKSLGDLKKNLANLSNAHEKLRFLLQELESLTKKT